MIVIKANVRSAARQPTATKLCLEFAGQTKIAIDFLADARFVALNKHALRFRPPQNSRQALAMMTMMSKHRLWNIKVDDEFLAQN